MRRAKQKAKKKKKAIEHMCGDYTNHEVAASISFKTDSKTIQHRIIYELKLILFLN